MKGKRIEGRCYKERTKQGLFRMKKKSREDIEVERYMKAVAYLDRSEECSIVLVGDKPEINMDDSEDQTTIERRSIIDAPNENPAVWLAMGI